MTEDRAFKKSHPEPKGGWTKDDTQPRCIKCGHGRDESGKMIGTPLSRITIKVSSSSEPFIPVAEAVICRRCHRLYSVKPMEAAGELKISLANVEACLKDTKNGDSFKITELQSGRMENLEYSPALKEIFARHKNRPAGDYNMRTEIYNPDAHVEPAQEALPF